MQFTAKSENVRVSPRKARAIARSVSTLPLPQALVKLEFLTKNGSREMKKILESALANAHGNKDLEADKLKIKSILVSEGAKMKRYAKGRKATSQFGPGIVQKRTSHIKVILTND